MILTGFRRARRAMIGGAVAAFLAFAPSAQAQNAPDSFADLAERLSPAVVNISTSQVLDPGRRTVPGVPEDSPLHDFFRDFMEQQGQQPQRVQSLGSGFFIDPSGIVVTNNHVIDGADEIEVAPGVGTTLPATLMGRDPKTDIAVLKVESRTPLPSSSSATARSARRRLGDRDRQSLRSRRHGDGRYHLGAQPRYSRRQLRRFHPDGRLDQSGQFRRTAFRHGRPRGWRQFGDHLAIGRVGRYRLCHSRINGSLHRRPDYRAWRNAARLDWRAHPDGDAGNRR